jgi:PAS domain S-box-containing protein
MSNQHDPRSGAAATAVNRAAVKPLPAVLPEELRELLAAAFFAANEPISIAVADLDEPRIVFVNQAFTDFTGYAADELVGGLPRLFTNPEADLDALRARVVAGHCIQGEANLCRKDGAKVWTEFRAAPIRDSAGRVTHYVTTQHDVSARRHGQETAERSSQAQSLLLSRISHELLTPLTSLIGFPEMLLDGHFGPLNDRQQQSVTHILNAGEQLRGLLHDLLDLARLDSGRLHLEWSRFDLGALLGDLAGPVVEAARRKGLSLEVEVTANLPLVEGDPVRLKQVVLNLLGNAVKYTPSGGWVKLRAWPGQSPAGEPLVRLAVEDSGIGIRQEDQERIFHMFEQVDPSLTRHYSGTGLGLALVGRLLALHGGRAWVESRGEGQGSTFHAEIPGLRQEPGEGDKGKENEKGSPGLDRAPGREPEDGGR